MQWNVVNAVQRDARQCNVQHVMYVCVYMYTSTCMIYDKNITTNQKRNCNFLSCWFSPSVPTGCSLRGMAKCNPWTATWNLPTRLSPENCLRRRGERTESPIQSVLGTLKWQRFGIWRSAMIAANLMACPTFLWTWEVRWSPITSRRIRLKSLCALQALSPRSNSILRCAVTMAMSQSYATWSARWFAPCWIPLPMVWRYELKIRIFSPSHELLIEVMLVDFFSGCYTLLTFGWPKRVCEFATAPARLPRTLILSVQKTSTIMIIIYYNVVHCHLPMDSSYFLAQGSRTPTNWCKVVHALTMGPSLPFGW